MPNVNDKKDKSTDGYVFPAWHHNFQKFTLPPDLSPISQFQLTKSLISKKSPLCESRKQEKLKARKVVKTECRTGVQNMCKMREISSRNESGFKPEIMFSLRIANYRVSPATAGCLRARNGPAMTGWFCTRLSGMSKMGLDNWKWKTQNIMLNDTPKCRSVK